MRSVAISSQHEIYLPIPSSSTLPNSSSSSPTSGTVTEPPEPRRNTTGSSWASPSCLRSSYPQAPSRYEPHPSFPFLDSFSQELAELTPPQTIFGMVEFFEVDKANDKELNVSPAWIVYWKVTIPLTVALIVVLFGWFNLQSVRRRVPPPGPLPAALQGLFSRSPPDEYSVDDEEKRLSSLGSLDYDLGGKSYLIERYGGHLPISQQNSGEGRLSSVSTAGYKGFFGSFFAKLISGEFFNAGFKRKPVPPLARVRPSMRERSRS